MKTTSLYLLDCPIELEFGLRKQRAYIGVYICTSPYICGGCCYVLSKGTGGDRNSSGHEPRSVAEENSRKKSREVGKFLYLVKGKSILCMAFLHFKKNCISFME